VGQAEKLEAVSMAMHFSEYDGRDGTGLDGQLAMHLKRISLGLCNFCPNNNSKFGIKKPCLGAIVGRYFAKPPQAAILCVALAEKALLAGGRNPQGNARYA
jgi:hypothetical protein